MSNTTENSEDSIENIDVLEFIKSKNDLTSVDLSIFLFYIINQLIRIENNKNENIEDYFDSVKNIQEVFNTKSGTELQLLYNEHKEIINRYNQNNISIILDRQNINDNINLATKYFNSNKSINNILNSLHNNEDIMIKCEYKNLCPSCNGTTIHNTKYDKYMHCFNCDFCNDLRDVKEKHEKKRVKKLLIKQLDDDYNKKNPNKQIIIKDKPKLKNEKININNNYIQINIHQNIFNQSVVKTKDRFFEVFIRDKTNNIENVKHIFVYYMCRVKALELYPNQKINKALTYPLSAGLYTIHDNILHGLLRYKYTIKSRITELKLQNITINDNISIMVNPIKCIENKNNHCIEDITSIINIITATNSYGSKIEDFYLSDL